jgi:hypothetical protein
MRSRREPDSGRRLVEAALVLVLVQAGVGVVVNLYAHIPGHHPGAHPSSYLGGSFHSVVWALAHATPALATHAGLGLALALLSLAVPVRLLRLGRGGPALWSLLAAALVIGAAFNGASFLDYGHNTSSLVMALLALSAAGCYGLLLPMLA